MNRLEEGNTEEDTELLKKLSWQGAMKGKIKISCRSELKKQRSFGYIGWRKSIAHPPGIISSESKIL